MTTATRQAGNGGVEEQPTDTGYISSLAARPHALMPPGPQPCRWAELGAIVAWVLGSWLRPGDADAAWEQQAGRQHQEP
jgi:hypothetical protein